MEKHWKHRLKQLEEIALRHEKSKEEGIQEKRETPSKATKAVNLDNFNSSEQYIRAKMGALIGASDQWGTIEEVQHLLEKRVRKGNKLKEQIEDGDEKAVFDFIRLDCENLGSPTVQRKISEWQDKVTTGRPKDREKYRKLLKKIGECLIPNMKGIREKAILSREEVLKSFWGLEWRWFYLIKYLEQRNWPIEPIEELDSGFKKKCEEYGFNPENVYSLFDSHFNQGLEPIAKYLAAYETAKLFDLDEQTVLNLIMKYR